MSYGMTNTLQMLPLVTEDDIQVKGHKIILISSSIKNILHLLTVYDMQDKLCD